MKTKILLTIIAFTASIVIISCKKDKDDNPAKPVITINELGEGDSHSNNHVGIIGSDLHIEADIVAEGKIKTVKVLIHQEDNSNAWTSDSVYTEFAGLKNTTFHKHIDIPLTADTGTYCFHFIVTDESGQESSVEIEDLKIKTPTDTVFPQVTISTAPTTNQIFTNGQTISITGTVSDNIALGGMYIGLVRVDQGLTDAQVNDGNTITLLHNHDFPNPVSHSFSASIIVGAAMDNNITPKPITWTPGNYYILVKCKDAFGGNWTFSSHYNIVIN